MTLDDILQDARHLSVFERRSLGSEFCELVVFSKDLDSWAAILAHFLGAPVKPAGREPSEKNLAVTEKTGGIRFNQTLFEKKFNGKTVIAKFWPWSDDRYVTLKMAMLLA